MYRIFISYRRADTGIVAPFLFKELERNFGEKIVFMDTQDIRIGENWVSKINEALIESSILIILIGKLWLTLKDKDNKRRITKNDDWVRNEILHFKNNNKYIIPLLLYKDFLLNKNKLPKELKFLQSIQSYFFNSEDISNSSTKLIELIIDRGIYSNLVEKHNVEILSDKLLSNNLSIEENVNIIELIGRSKFQNKKNILNTLLINPILSFFEKDAINVLLRDINEQKETYNLFNTVKENQLIELDKMIPKEDEFKYIMIRTLKYSRNITRKNNPNFPLLEKAILFAITGDEENLRNILTKLSGLEILN